MEFSRTFNNDALAEWSAEVDDVLLENERVMGNLACGAAARIQRPGEVGATVTVLTAPVSDSWPYPEPPQAA